MTHWGCLQAPDVHGLVSLSSQPYIGEGQVCMLVALMRSKHDKWGKWAHPLEVNGTDRDFSIKI